MQAFESGWWMNVGFSSDSNAAYSSTAMWSCALSGSSSPNDVCDQRPGVTR